MKNLIFALMILLLGCNQQSDKNNEETSIFSRKTSNSPRGAVIGNFEGNGDSIFAFVKNVDLYNEKTTIAFQNDKLPIITISESIGAELKILKLENFQSAVLLINAKLKDSNFNEYYVYVWKDFVWKQPINRFNIHKSNMTYNLIPISNNPKDSTKLLRYYSVFEMDRKNDKKFTWTLLQESIPIDY